MQQLVFLRYVPGYPTLCMGYNMQEEMEFMGFLSMAPAGCTLGSEADERFLSARTESRCWYFPVSHSALANGQHDLDS